MKSTTKPDTLWVVEIVGKLAILDVDAIATAQCSSCVARGCAGGYMRDACPGEVCEPVATS